MGIQDTSDASALAIYQDLLDRISSSYVLNDFDKYALMLRVPHKITTIDGTFRIETKGDLRALFDKMRGNLAQRGISDYTRTCLAANFEGAETIIGAHETRLLDVTHVLEQPYPVKSILRKIDGAWWVCESDNAIDASSSIGRLLERMMADRGRGTGSPLD